MSKDSSNVVSLPTIDEKLCDGVVALRQLAACYNLLDKGMYPHTHLGAVTNAMAYVKLLHNQMKDKVLAHPDSDKIPELVELKKHAEEEAAKLASMKTDLPDASKVIPMKGPEDVKAEETPNEQA